MFNFFALRLGSAQLGDLLGAGPGAEGQGEEQAGLDEDLFAGACQVISDRRSIASILRGLVDRQQPLTMNGRAMSHSIQTGIAGFDAAGEQMLLPQHWHEAEHAALLRDGVVNLSALYRGSPILFTVSLQLWSDENGTPFYRAALPQWLLFAQMRDSLRVRPNERLQVAIDYTLPDGEKIRARVLDISEGGAGIILPAPMPALSVGDVWQPATLTSREGPLGVLKLKVCHIPPDAKEPKRIGVAIDMETDAQRKNLRRFILQHQPLPSRQE